MSHSPGVPLPSRPPGHQQRIVVRVIAVPATLFGALMLGCFAIAPVAIFDLSTDQANWWPVYFYAGLTILATAGGYALGMRRWLPLDLPLWLIALYVLAPLGDHLDADGGLALTLFLLGVVLFFATVARLIVFHVRRYREEHASGRTP